MKVFAASVLAVLAYAQDTTTDADTTITDEDQSVPSLSEGMPLIDIYDHDTEKLKEWYNDLASRKMDLDLDLKSDVEYFVSETSDQRRELQADAQEYMKESHELDKEAVADILEFMADNIWVNDMPLGDVLPGLRGSSLIRTQPYVMTTKASADFNKHLSMCAVEPLLSDDSVEDLLIVGQRETFRGNEALQQRLDQLQAEVEKIAANSEQIKAQVTQYYDEERDAVLAGIDTAKENIVPAFNATRDAVEEGMFNVYFGLEQLKDDLRDDDDEDETDGDEKEDDESDGDEKEDDESDGDETKVDELDGVVLAEKVKKAKTEDSAQFSYGSFATGAIAMGAIAGAIVYLNKREQKKETLLGDSHFMSA